MEQYSVRINKSVRHPGICVIAESAFTPVLSVIQQETSLSADFLLLCPPNNMFGMVGEL